MLTTTGFHRTIWPWAALGLLVLVMTGGVWAADDTVIGDSTSSSLVGSGRTEVLMKWGETALTNNRFNEAEDCFREVLDSDWNNPHAFELLQQTRKARTATIKTWRGEARSAEADSRWDRAGHYYEMILTELPNDAASADGVRRAERHQQSNRYVQAGLQHFALGDFAQAQSEFEHALDVTPNDSLVALYLQRAEQETMQSSSLADIRADESSWSKYLDALKRFRAGDFPGAEALWRQVLDKYPGNEAVLSNLEQITRRRKKEFSAEDVNP